MIEWEEHKEGCCVVIPVYKTTPSLFEQMSLKQAVNILGKKRDIFLVAPPDLDLSVYMDLCPEYRFGTRRLAKGFFENIDGYNQMCKRWEFYSTFSGYEYMLIYQLDCWIFEDRLDHFMSLGYDYIGAPWFEWTQDRRGLRMTKCGNGGFSLRRIKRMQEVCRTHEEEADNPKVPEDVFFSVRCRQELKICPLEVGAEFSFEVAPSILYKYNDNKLPMGCHKPYLFEYKTFWKKYITF